MSSGVNDGSKTMRIIDTLPKVIAVNWLFGKASGNPGSPGNHPIPVLRYRSQRIAGQKGQNRRPHSGLTMPRRNGAHGASKNH